jgi:aquaporin Z
MREHAQEYACEALLLGLFMVSAGLVTTALEAPGSPLVAELPSAFERRALIGLAMGLTAIGLIYSPFGQRSGAHMNPALTLTYLRLGKVTRGDAFAYAAAQVAGGIAGVALVALILGREFEDAPVSWAATMPGTHGPLGAFAAEVAISFGLMTTALVCTSLPRIAPYTGWFCGLLVSLYITFEAPLSGMSMNPARSLASALFPGLWTHFWVYVAGPVVGMLGAAELYARVRGGARVRCAKLNHSARYRCIFCGYVPEQLETR